MRIFSVLLRVLTVLCVGGGITLWIMARDNIKRKLGGDPNDPHLGTTIDAIFNEQTDSVYKVIQADAESEPKWKAVNDGGSDYETTFADAHPYNVLTDQNLKTAATAKLELKYPDPSADKDENGVADMDEQLPSEIRSLPAQDLYDKEEQMTLEEAESNVDGALKTLQDQQYRTDVLDPVRKEFTGKEEKPIIDRKNPYEKSSKETLENQMKTALGKLYWERDRLFREISKVRKLAVTRDQDLQDVQKRYIAKSKEKDNFETESDHFQLKLQDKSREFELAKKDWGEEKDALDQKIQTTEDNLRAAEIAKDDLNEEWKVKMTQTREDYEGQLTEKGREIIAAEQRGYEKGVAEAEEAAGVRMAGQDKPPPNIFDLPPDIPAQPTVPVVPGVAVQPPAVTTPIASGLAEESFSGVITNIQRVSARDGLIILPLGTENGLAAGNTLTLVKEGKQAARIKVTQAHAKYCVANILPQFGDPKRLRPGDQILVMGQ